MSDHEKKELLFNLKFNLRFTLIINIRNKIFYVFKKNLRKIKI